MKALARFGKAFGGYKMIDVPQPICGPEDVVIEIKAAAICGADMKHYNVDSGSDEFNSIRGHEFAGCIAQVGEKVKDWKVGQRVVSDNSGHVCGVCPACEQGDFLCCAEKVNLGLDNNTLGGGFSKYCLVLVKFSKFIVMRCGKSLMVLIMRTQPYLTLSVMPTNPSRSNRNSSWSGCGRHRHWPTRAVLRTNGADYGGGKYRRRWSTRRCGGPIPGCKRTGCDGSSKWFYRRCGGALPANLWQRQSGTGD